MPVLDQQLEQPKSQMCRVRLVVAKLVLGECHQAAVDSKCCGADGKRFCCKSKQFVAGTVVIDAAGSDLVRCMTLCRRY